ncbi:MAG: hypothetical protein DRP83_00020 [Planctomycetota bacterium]|nr:MAG: hypothetical protein DRP83_00020 [Planctomycetota bacterium]
MSNLNSLFDIVTRDPHPNALASLMVILDVAGAPGPAPSGTPVAGTIGPGTIVMMDAAGEAVLGDSGAWAAATPIMYMVAVDGDMDYDGAFLHRITTLEGGLQMKTEQFVAGVYVPGQPLTVGTGPTAGQLLGLTLAGEPLVAFVGPNGVNADGTLDVIMPQSNGR